MEFRNAEVLNILFVCICLYFCISVFYIVFLCSWWLVVGEHVDVVICRGADGDAALPSILFLCFLLLYFCIL